ncbi:hypothetical protein FRC00_011138 [Tulasnella sp. 408]|nr:hypothetical protein FRC00_011138 [Tulasnella sp. 408]
MALRRSSIHLLDITFIYLTYQERGPEKMQEFLNIINVHRNRWRTLDVSATFDFTPLAVALQGPAPNLEKVSLTDKNAFFSTHGFGFFGGTAPRLKDLTLNGVATPWDSQIIHDLHFIDLSRLHFPSTKTILDILSYSPQLQKAVIWRCTTGETPADPSDSIRLSQLSFLRIDLGRLEAIENILDSVQVSQRGCLTIPFPTDGDVEGFLRRRVAGWTLNWNVTAMSKLDVLLLDSDADELRIGILAPDIPEPRTLTVKGFKTLGNQFLLALSNLVDTLAAWSGENVKLHLKLGNPPSTYYATRIRQLFVNELSRLPPITSLEISSVDDYSLIDIVVYEGAWSVFQNVCTLSFSGMTPSKLNKRLEWVSHAIRFVKAATESSLQERDHMPKLQTVELRVSSTAVPEEVEIIGAVAKELKLIVWPGRVVVVYTDPNGLV